jgi:UDP-N-acetylmuramoyl-tripeptide--D-alanyl-D-alanine ligase
MSTDPYLVLRILFPRGWMYIKTRLVGSYNFENVLAAVTIGQHFRVDPQDITSGIEEYSPENNRSQMVRTERNNLLMDAYNANPSSMRAALENFNLLSSRPKGVILGDMLELGSVTGEEHQKIADYLASMDIDCVILVGPNFGQCNLPQAFLHFDHSTDLQIYLKKVQLTGFLLLVKGSRGMKLETIAAEL